MHHPGDIAMPLANRTGPPVLWAILAVLLSRLSPSVYARSVGWVYQDLALDRPTYNVHLLQEPLSLSSVVANNHHPTTCALHSDNLLAAGNVHSTVVMTKPDGSRWSCRVPHSPSARSVVKKTNQEIEREEQGHIKRGLALLDPLEGRCLVASYRSWTYEFCYKGAIRQYYEADTDENKQPHEYAPVYVLGRFRSPIGLESFEEHKDSKPFPWSRKEPSTEFETKHDRNYLVQAWDHGDVCSLTNLPRQIRVHYQCALIPEARIYSVTEPTVCSYVIVINTPQLCIEPAFRMIRPPAPEPIQCRPIVLETKEALGKTAPNSLVAPQKLTQLSGHTLNVHLAEEASRLTIKDYDNGGNGRQWKHESGTGALLGYLGSLRLTSNKYPIETTRAPSSSKAVSEHFQGEDLDRRLDQLSDMMAEIDVAVLEQEAQGSVNEYSERTKENIKNGGRVLIHDLPQEELVEALEEAKERLEVEADEEEDRMSIDEDD